MLVGRARELTVLCGSVDRRVPVVVVGGAGIGKTTLLRATVERCGRPAFVGGGLATLSWVTYLPLARALRQAPPTGDPAAVASDVTTRVGGGVLVVDDLQWSDAGTLELLPLLAGRVALLAGLRAGEATTARVRSSAEACGFELLELGPLAETEARVLVRRRPGLGEREVDRVVQLARGNPLLLEELVGDQPSETLRLALRARLRRCSDEARETLAVLGLLGHPAPAELVGAAIEELLDAHLVVDDGGYTIRHELIGEAAVAELGPAARRRLHAELARALADPGESARHHHAAGESEQAHAKALLAAETAATPGERARHLGVAAECATEGPDAVELRLRAAAALVEAGEYDTAERIAGEIADGTAPQLARAALCRARASWALGDVASARRELDSGFALVSGTDLAAEAELRLEQIRFEISKWSGPETLRRAADTWELVSRAGLDEGVARCRFAMALYVTGSRECLDHLAAVLRHARDRRDYDLECEAAIFLSSAYQMLGGPADALALAREMVERVRALRLRGWELVFRWQSARLELLHRGAYADAIEELGRVIAEPGLGPDREQATADLALALADVGRDAEARALVQQVLPTASTPWERAMLLFTESEVEWTAGRAARAAAAAERVLRENFEVLQPIAVRSRAWGLVDAGRAVTPVPFAAPEPAPFIAGVAPETAALACFGDPSRALEAERLFVEAARLWSSQIVREELRCLWAAGEAARRAGALDRARERLLEVEQRAASHGLTPLVARIHRSLRLAGVRRAAPRRARSGVLTAREREVLALVASGRTSLEIARRLGLAPGTVDAEVRSAMTKLSAATRIQAAILATGDEAAAEPRRVPPFAIVRAAPGGRAAAARELERAGWRVQEGWELPQGQWSLARSRLVCSGVVSSEEDAAAALLAAARGAGLIVELAADGSVSEPFLDDLRHLGSIEHLEPPPHDRLLDAEQVRLLELVAEGRSIAEAAALTHLSIRTADRRLAAARAALGVRTTAEAALVVRNALPAA